MRLAPCRQISLWFGLESLSGNHAQDWGQVSGRTQSESTPITFQRMKSELEAFWSLWEYRDLDTWGILEFSVRKTAFNFPESLETQHLSKGCKGGQGRGHLSRLLVLHCPSRGVCTGLAAPTYRCSQGASPHGPSPTRALTHLEGWRGWRDKWPLVLRGLSMRWHYRKCPCQWHI